MRKSQKGIDTAYVYRHIRLDKNEVFYIGIGTMKNYGRAFHFRNRNKHWTNIFNKTEIEVEILRDNLTWDEAQGSERFFIELYGRRDLNKGTLVNWTDGGEGGHGKIVTEETKKKQSKIHKGKKLSEEHKRKIGLAGTGRVQTEETIEKRVAYHRGKKRGKGARLNMSNGIRTEVISCITGKIYPHLMAAYRAEGDPTLTYDWYWKKRKNDPKFFLQNKDCGCHNYEPPLNKNI